MSEKLILAFESSCDDTSIALMNIKKELIGYKTKSKPSTHGPHGGIVPELASRDHISFCLKLLHELLTELKLNIKDIDTVAYTAGPGLIGSLLVSASIAAGIAKGLSARLMPVHHLEGHLLSPFLTEKVSFPFLMLLVSGGHTLLVEAVKFRHYRVLGQTLDDSAGECLDKSAKLMNLGFPGGPQIEKLALVGDESKVALPHPLKNKGLNFSFSGLKTAVMHAWEKNCTAENLCASLQATVIDVLKRKSWSALQLSQLDTLVVVGGVSANKALRSNFNDFFQSKGVHVYFPDLKFATDNAAMIAMAAAMSLEESIAIGEFQVKPRWPLDSLSSDKIE